VVDPKIRRVDDVSATRGWPLANSFEGDTPVVETPIPTWFNDARWSSQGYNNRDRQVGQRASRPPREKSEGAGTASADRAIRCDQEGHQRRHNTEDQHQREQLRGFLDGRHVRHERPKKPRARGFRWRKVSSA